jgi:hypothetical protein
MTCRRRSAGFRQEAERPAQAHGDSRQAECRYAGGGKFQRERNSNDGFSNVNSQPHVWISKRKVSNFGRNSFYEQLDGWKPDRLLCRQNAGRLRIL